MDSENLIQGEEKLKSDSAPIKKKSKFSVAFKIVSNIVFLFVVFLLIGNFAFEWGFSYAHVIGESMQPTLNYYYVSGDTTTYDTVLYCNDKAILRGDIIIADSPNETNKDVIKRVIGIGGDTIKITKVYSTADHKYLYDLYLNGQILEEEYIKSADDLSVDYDRFYNIVNGLKTTKSELFSQDTFGDWVLTVPSNYIFYLGDNRGNSTDCSVNGPQPLTTLVSKVAYIIRVNEEPTQFSWFFTRVIGGYNYIFQSIGI